MGKPLSTDLPDRVIVAVYGGMSRRAAAEQFGVAASTAIPRVEQWQRRGSVRPRPLGGGNRSQRIEVHNGEILPWWRRRLT